MLRSTRRVGLSDVSDLLEAPPRANLSFRTGTGVTATPVAFRFGSGRHWFGIATSETAADSTSTGGPAPGDTAGPGDAAGPGDTGPDGVRATAAARRGEPVKLLIDEGRWYFDLRGVLLRGHAVQADPVPDGADPSLVWFELVMDASTVWDSPPCPPVGALNRPPGTAPEATVAQPPG